MSNHLSEPHRPALLARRALFGSAVLATLLLIAWRAFLLLQSNGWSALKGVIFALFVLLLFPICFSFWTALLGFFVQSRRGAQEQPTPGAEHVSHGSPLPRTAIIMPVYNEDPVRVFAGLQAVYESLQVTGLLEHFDFFVLSDSRDPTIWVKEQLAYAELLRELQHTPHLHYRNRRENLDRKTGNIADFCATWGEHFKYMVVLDADSVMSGSSIVHLVQLMEQHPRAGIIQAPPLPVNRRTLFGRLHQFAMHAYSALFITGLNFWQGGTANYWGHNAIVRVRPFMDHCRLPKLPGKAPLGGPILSHDFVEAAFLRRAGWHIYLAPDLRGSYEELPSSLLNYATRDRRWCQGNLQHARLLFTHGFHPVSRIHIMTGVMAYLSAPLWMLLMALTTWQGLKEKLGAHPYFPPGHSLFPNWPISVQHESIILFLLIMGLLLAPKLLSLIIHFGDRTHLNGFGGRLKFIGSLLAEILGSTLLAPNLALLQTRFVFGILMGRNVSWESQNRGEEGTTSREAVHRHWPATVLGLAWALLLGLTVPKLLWWFSPVILGLILAIPLSIWSSRSTLGEWTSKHGIFVIPDESSPPPVLQRLQHGLETLPDHPWAQLKDGLAFVLENPYAFELHLSMIAPPPTPPSPIERNYLYGLVLKAGEQGWQSLTPQEKRRLLLDADSLRNLQRTYFPAAGASPPAHTPAPLPALDTVNA